MNQSVAGNNLRKIRILVAPLDWGLGHATRCIPIIRELIHLGCEPLIAAESAQHSLLKLEFPNLIFLPLDGYRIRYSTSGPGLAFKLLFQSGKILNAIKKENQWLKKAVEEHQIDAVISDNRFGLYHDKIPCVFITHQLRIKSSWGGWTERMLQEKNYRMIERFKSCWVPDYQQSPGLAGDLSHPRHLPTIPVEYIGPLSRFQKSINEENRILILLSGPEPQRTLLENTIVSEIAHYPGQATVVRGIPGSEKLIPSTNTIRFYNHLSTAQLNEEFSNAFLILSRSGYSTVMDVMKMEKKAVFIPTPGQTEQLFLSKILEENGVAPSISQKDFSIKRAIEMAKNFSYQKLKFPEENSLSQSLLRFILSLT